jgi:hypothetical protein
LWRHWSCFATSPQQDSNLSLPKGASYWILSLDSKLTTLTGTKVPAQIIKLHNGNEIAFPETCRFNFVLPPGKKALRWLQQGVPFFHNDDKNTCEALFEVGTPARYGPKESEETKAIGNAKAVLGRRDTYETSRGIFRMFWKDPPGFQVTWAKSDITWSWEGPLLCAHYNYGFFEDWGASITGWQKVSQWSTGSITAGCVHVGYTGSSRWANQVFPPCNPFAPMYVNYDPIQAYGQNDGYLIGSGSTAVTGPGLCYLLLTPGSEIVRTSN